jgi:acyl-CoA thioesterase
LSSLRDVVAGLEAEAGAYRIETPAAWAQGRTLYGGMTAALSLASARRAHVDLPPLRSAQVAFIGPAAGRLTFTSTILRQGRSATVVGVDCQGEQGLAARCTFTLGGDRESRIRHDLAPAPAVPPPDECPPFFEAGGFRPGFSPNFDYRLANGFRPLSGGASPEFTVWLRLHDEEGIDPEVALIAIADAPPPAAFVAFPQAGPVSTMTWTLDVTQPLPAAGWRLVRSASEQAGAGYSLQDMAVWDERGRRLAAGRQTVALFV